MAPKADQLWQSAMAISEASREDEVTMSIAVILGAYLEGCCVERVAAFLGLIPSQVQPFAENLKRSGIWTEEGLLASGDYAGEEGEYFFVLDSCCAMGLIEHSSD